VVGELWVNDSTSGEVLWWDSLSYDRFKTMSLFIVTSGFLQISRPA
jgi:hypothetical protein